MPRSMSDIGEAALLSREANKTKAYKDSVGVWTIGVGHTAGAGEPIPRAGMTITAAEGIAIFKRDIKSYEAAVVKGLGASVCDNLTQNQFDALVSICFNIGKAWFTGEWKKGKATFVKDIIAGNIDKASANIMRFVKPAVIKTRREAERMQFDTPYDVSLPFGRSNDKSPIKAPKQTVPTLAPKITERPLVGIVGTLGNLVTKVTGRAPNVVDMKDFPPGFKGDVTLGLIQAELRRKGYTEVGKIDGWDGDATRTAIENIRRDNNKSFPYELDEKLLAAIKAMPDKPVAIDRAVATTADVQNAAPEIMRPINNLLKIGIGLGTAGGLTGLSDTLKQAQEAVDTAKETYEGVKPLIDVAVPALRFVADHPGIVYGGLAVLCFSLVAFHAAAAVQMFRTKRIN